MRDTSWFGQKIVDKLAGVIRGGTAPDDAGPKVGDLTPRARDVVGLMARGLSDAEVAAKLDMSEHAGRNHVSAIHKVGDVRRPSALIVWARAGPDAKTRGKTKANKGRLGRTSCLVPVSHDTRGGCTCTVLGTLSRHC